MTQSVILIFILKFALYVILIYLEFIMLFISDNVP